MLVFEYDYSYLLTAGARTLPRPQENGTTRFGDSMVFIGNLEEVGAGQGCQERYRISDNLGVVISHFAFKDACLYRYHSDDAWITLEYRLAGWFGGGPARAGIPYCALTYKPGGMPVEKTMQAAEKYAAVSVLFRASALEATFGAPITTLPGILQDMVASDQPAQHRIALAGRNALMEALNEIRYSDLEGYLRLLSLKGRVLDLVARTLEEFEAARALRQRPKALLSERETAAVYKARDLIERDLSARVTLEALCRHCGLNRNKLSRLFQLLFGQTVKQYSNELRMLRAFEMLSGQRKTVTEVAIAVGFDDASSLRAPFKERYGCNPADLLRQDA